MNLEREPFYYLETEPFYYWDASSQLKDHIYERSRDCFRLGDEQRDKLRSKEEVVARQNRLRRFFVESLGGLPPLGTPLQSQVTGTVKGDTFTVEKVIFQSRPRHYVTANLYLPHDRAEKGPAVLFLCGHSRGGKHDDTYQVICQILVKAGLIVLAQDPIGQGERRSYYEPATGQHSIAPGVADHDYAGTPAVLLGDSCARYFLHDSMRAVDYLLSRPEVDPAKIGVMGGSGGGTQTSMMMMADTRIAAAAPACFLTNRDCFQRSGWAQDAEQIWPAFTREGYDHEDILLAVAPKPVCVLAVTADFFPIEGTRRTVERARRLWRLWNKDDALSLFEDVSVHNFTHALGYAAARFFASHLDGRKVDASSFSTGAFAQDLLWCTKAGQVCAEFKDAEFVHESNRERAGEFKKLRLKKGSVAALDWLKQIVEAHRKSGELNPRLVRTFTVENFAVEHSFWWPTPDLFNSGLLFRPGSPSAQPRSVTIALWDQGTRALVSHAAWLRKTCEQGGAVLVLNLSGMGPHEPAPVSYIPLHNDSGTLYKLQDDLHWLQDSLCALRIHQVLRSLDLISLWPGLNAQKIELYGEGRPGVYAWLAAALDKRILQCAWENRFTYGDWINARYYDSYDVKPFLLPGVLQHFDLDEITPIACAK